MVSTLDGEQSGQRREHGAVWPGGAWAGDLTAQDRDLMSEYEDFGVLGRLLAGQQREPAEELAEDEVQESQRHDWRSSRISSPCYEAAGQPSRRRSRHPQDALEPLAAKHAEAFDAWGYRKIWGLLRADGIVASQSSVRRAMGRRGLLQPVGYQAERRQLATARRAAFLYPPARRNRVWQTDFSELESLAGGIWRMSGVVDYWAKLALACPVTTTQATRDAIAALEAASAQAEALLGVPLLEDCVDPTTGELQPVVVVTDNGPCYRSVAFQRYIAARPELLHVRTRYRSPQTNGVIERFYESIKYEHLYRREISDGLVLAQEVASYLTVYNSVRPHEAIGFATPLTRYLEVPSTPPTANLPPSRTVSDS